MPSTPEELLELHGKAVLGFLINRLRTVDDALDLYQEICLRVVRAWGHYQPDRPRGWIFTIARNVLTNFRTREQPKRGLSLEGINEPSTLPATDPDPDPRLARLRSCLDRLSQEQREIVLGRVSGLSCAELAEKLTLAVEKVYDHAENGLQRLKRCLGNGVPASTNP